MSLGILTSSLSLGILTSSLSLGILTPSLPLWVTGGSRGSLARIAPSRRGWGTTSPVGVSSTAALSRIPSATLWRIPSATLWRIPATAPLLGVAAAPLLGVATAPCSRVAPLCVVGGWSCRPACRVRHGHIGGCTSLQATQTFTFDKLSFYGTRASRNDYNLNLQKSKFHYKVI